MKHLAAHRPATSRAFSLVEVTIALAIAALGFVSLLGLLPQGLEMGRKTAEMGVGSKIIQHLSGELQSTPWDKINWTGYGGRRYFNDEGGEIPQSRVNDPSNSAGPLTYVAAIFVPVPALDVVLPSGGKDFETQMRRVRICITTSTDPNFDFANAPPRRVTSLPLVIAKMGE